MAKICLIEDDDLIRDLYIRQFNLAGLTTEGFAQGRAGLLALQKNHYDLLLLDIMLPDINGLEILKRLKLNEATKKIPVLLLSNLGEDSVIQQGFALGADGYLVKLNYTPDQVIQEVKNILGKSSSQ